MEEPAPSTSTSLLDSTPQELSEWMERVWGAVALEMEEEENKNLEASYPGMDPAPNQDYSPEGMPSSPQRVSDGMVGFGSGRTGRKRTRSPSPTQGEMPSQRRRRSPSPSPREAEARRAGPAQPEEEPTFRPKEPPQAAPFIIRELRNTVNTRYQ